MNNRVMKIDIANDITQNHVQSGKAISKQIYIRGLFISK